VLAALAPQNLTAKKTDGLLNGWVAEIRLAALLPLVSKPPMNRTLNILGFLIFASALSVRAIDPVVPQIAADLSVSLNTAALLAAGFAAYGLVQPVLGPVADAFGKARVMIACLLLLAVSSFLSAIVTDFWLLFALRVLAGAASVRSPSGGSWAQPSPATSWAPRSPASSPTSSIGAACSSASASSALWRWRLAFTACAGFLAANRSRSTCAPCSPATARSLPSPRPASATARWRSRRCFCSASFPMPRCCCCRAASRAPRSRAWSLRPSQSAA
jgi:MFS family permease